MDLQETSFESIKQEMDAQAAAVDSIVNQAKAEADAQHQKFLMEMEAGSRSASQLPLDVQMRMSHPEHFGVQGGLPLDVRQRLGTTRL